MPIGNLASAQRREFISFLGGGAAGWSFSARAQQNEPVRRIGVLMTTADDREGQRRLNAFREGLEKRGWSESKNIRIEVNWSVSDPERARSVVNEVIGRAPDLILTSGTSATTALNQARPAIPVVFTVVSEPVEGGFVKSLAHPGGNMTGFTNLEPSLATGHDLIPASRAHGLKTKRCEHPTMARRFTPGGFFLWGLLPAKAVIRSNRQCRVCCRSFYLKTCPAPCRRGFSFHHAQSVLTFKHVNGARDFRPVQRSGGWYQITPMRQLLFLTSHFLFACQPYPGTGAFRASKPPSVIR